MAANTTVRPRSFTESKKTTAYAVAQACWTLYLFVYQATVIWMGGDVPIFYHWNSMAVIIVMGFLQVGTIGGLAWIDRYLYVAQATIAGANKQPIPDAPIVAEAITGDGAEKNLS